VPTRPDDTGRILILYSGNLAPLPHKRFIPYSAVGFGQLRVGGKRERFLTTSVGLVGMVAPTYETATPFIHIYSGKTVLGRFFRYVANRAFFSGGIATTALTYRGQSLGTSNVKGVLGVGMFLVPGVGVSFDYNVGGTLNANPAVDSRSRPFHMPGLSLRFTGDMTTLFQDNIGKSLAPQVK
jgi:hypothetical protein